jgi:hypothetical protein
MRGAIVEIAADAERRGLEIEDDTAPVDEQAGADRLLDAMAVRGQESPTSVGRGPPRRPFRRLVPDGDEAAVLGGSLDIRFTEGDRAANKPTEPLMRACSPSENSRS